MNSELQVLSEAQQRLVTNAQLMSVQISRQKEFCENIVKKSKELTNELRLLSIVRAKIIKNKIRSTDKIVSSPSFQGLQLCKIEYCPPFISPNLINHYTYFCTYMRKNPEILAKILFEYSKKNPEKVTTLAYSLFLTLYQQGWCIEEDLMIFEILTCMADLQFNVDQPNAKKMNKCYCVPYPPRKLKYSLDLSDAAVGKYLPFITFSTAYLFNGASFSYLQSSLAPIILKLHSLSSLYDLRTTFEAIQTQEKVSLANYSYWKVILSYAKQVLDALEKCLPLLPPSTFGLFAYLKSMNADIFLVFFEAFINRALDNPAVLGLLPWHPSHGNWNPSKDIADVFRTKSLNSLPSKHLGNLLNVLDNFPEYKEIDINGLLDLLLIPPDSHVSYMISEAELLSTNPAFPKELLITTKDIALLHQATLEFSGINDDLRKILKNLGPVAKKDKNSLQHFRIVITRQVRRQSTICNPISPMSLFSNSSGDFDIVKKTSPYAEFFCDILSELPSPQQLGSTSIPEYIERVRSISNYFVSAKHINQADAVLWFASNKFIDDKLFMKKFIGAVDNRECRAMTSADRTSSLRTQNERIENYLFIVKSMRTNLQSNITLELAESFVKNDMCQQFIEASYHSHNFVNDIKVFKSTVSQVMKEAISTLVKMNIDGNESKEICRVLFFKLTEHVTFGRYMQSDATVWKRSVIVTKILEDKHDEILAIAVKGQPKSFQNNIPYLQRASDLLGHIRPNSGISVIVYYVLETIDLIQTLCNNCHELNFDGCLLWTFMNSKAKHIYLLSKFIQHFLLSENLLDKFLSHSEISGLSLLPSGVMYLIKILKKYDKRIILEWA